MKRHKVLALIGGIFLVLVLVVTACAAPAPTLTPAPTPTPTPTPTPAPTPAQEVYKWNFQSTWPPEMVEAIVEPFANYCREVSGGRLDITVYSGGELVKGEEVLSAVGEGTIEIGQSFGGYWSDIMPEGDIEGGLPYALRTRQDAHNRNQLQLQRSPVNHLAHDQASHLYYPLAKGGMPLARLQLSTSREGEVSI